MDKKLLNFTLVAVEGFGLSLIGTVSSSQPLRLLGKRFGFENFGSYLELILKMILCNKYQKFYFIVFYPQPTNSYRYLSKKYSDELASLRS